MNDVTIAIKTFERPQSLENLLVSIRRFYPSIPIMIADDSRKPSAHDMASRFSNLEYIPLCFDVGLSTGRNALLSRIRTKYFVLCDDDFIFDERTQLENFQKILQETDIELVGGFFHDITETGEFAKTHLYAGDLVLDSSRNLHMVVLNPNGRFIRCDIVPNFFMADTEAVRRKTGGWDPRLKVEEHTDFFWRAKQAGLKVAFTPYVSVNHTVARDDNYLFYRHIRKDKYHRLFFKKFGLKSFTDTWETITWQEIQPWWFVVLAWRNWNQKRKFNIRKIQTWMPDFIFKQKCIPWFVIQKWRDWKWNNALQLKKLTSKLTHKGIILMYHRVTNSGCDPWQLCVTPDHFDEHMRVLKEYGLTVPMREMGKNLKYFSLGDKKIVVSLDDGYRDNFTNAKPILGVDIDNVLAE